MHSVRTLTAAATLGLSAMVTGPVAAQDTEAAATTDAPRVLNGQRFGAWTVTCEAIAVGETACVLSQRLVQSGNDAFLAEILAFWAADGSQSYMAARVPNGVFLPSGFAMRPANTEDSEEDAAAQTEFVWQSCSPQLCEALVGLDDAMVPEWDSEAEFLAGYRPGLTAEPLVFRLSVAGLAEGLEMLKPQN